ncbi:Thioredoxin [Sulfurimonas denitrificans DSM 1251]|uniref:Thioredoxin n=1 Tax=Sulfurimonas denitrificans (strain ATCC 33889 / DSM 1251) TaxID=326298 RepID=Q30TA0_SULDN|nr:protein disulfide oxidoreductase [Sulfurimonas denitrificans]ABB43781.1 Thioredoxin [Sulfurimonas denitrificans DSM 1251]MDD3442452.1 protein disulfide oxidoreductase [Sulfurimonas denitrificans]
MKNKLLNYSKEIFLFLIFITIFSNLLSLYRSNNLNQDSIDVNSFTLMDGSSYMLSENKPILLHFWATWCPTCKAEAGNIETISKEFEVITIATKSGDNSNIQSYLKSRNLTFKVVNDNNGSLAEKFNISVFPTTIIYDKNREIFYSDVGYTTTFGLWLRMWLAK